MPIFHWPRPWVAATTYRRLGLTPSDHVATFGRPWPNRAQWLEPSRATNTPRSVATISLWWTSTTSSAGLSGRLPVMFFHVLPPFHDSNTWPFPPPGIQRRRNPPNVTVTWLASLRSTASPVMKRFGRFDAWTVCHVPPAFVSMPDWNGTP